MYRQRVCVCVACKSSYAIGSATNTHRPVTIKFARSRATHQPNHTTCNTHTVRDAPACMPLQGSVLLFGYDQKDALGYAEQSRDAELIDLLKDYTK